MTRLRIAGIDEVGRGPLAGPVVAAAVVLLRPVDGLDDSKKLPTLKREALAAALSSPGVARVGLGAASVAEIDRLNILQASLLAMRRAVMRLGCAIDLALIDGQHAPELPCAAQTVINGDGTVAAISAASIVAKVARDRLMRQLDGRYPGYGWRENVGYPTPAHRMALVELGITPHHRRSFAPVRERLLGLGDGGLPAD